MKKLINPLMFGLLCVGALACSGQSTSAQELLVPPQMELPTTPSLGSGARGSATRESLPSIELPPNPSLSTPRSNSDLTPEPIASGDLDFGLQPFEAANDYQAIDCRPALLESTGTWLRRGFWYSEVDAVVMDRIWRRDNFVLGFQQNDASTGIFGTGVDGNSLVIDGGRSGAEGSPRLTLGRFLFRDYKNRDHAMEFVAYGGGQWSQAGRLDAVAGVGDGFLTVGAYNNLSLDSRLELARIPLDNGNPSFDGASSMQYSYDSRMNNFELNYQVKSRMRKDRMEMEPSGQWVRRAQTSPSFSLLAGIRYFDLNEDFDWDAFGIDDQSTAATESETGNYKVRTDNDLIGAQLGGSWTFESARWSLGLKAKGGTFLNHTNMESQFSVTGGTIAGNNEATVDNISFLIEAGLIGKWHLRPNFSLRTGLEILHVSSVALASEQLNFTPVSTAIVDSGGSTYMGGSLGFEAYW